MVQVIYADTVFLLNLCMNFLALFAAGKIMNMNLKLARLALSAALGAAYSIFALLSGSAVIPVMIINIAVSVIMCLIAYKAETPVKFAKLFIIFYAACFVLGGGIQALYNLSGVVRPGGIDSAPVRVIIILAAACAVIFIFAGRLFRRSAGISDAEIIIGFAGREIKLNAILDTGNLLRDPVSSLPVIIINLNSAANLFDMKTLEFFTGDSPSYISQISADSDPDKMRLIKDLKFKIIPVRSVAGANNILPAFVPEYIKYIKNMAEINAVVAVDSGAGGKYGGDYNGIVPAELID